MLEAEAGHQQERAEVNAGDLMDADGATAEFNPLKLLATDGLSKDARDDIDELRDIPRNGTWDVLDNLPAAGLSWSRFDRCYPVLQIHLAEICIQADRLTQADTHLANALARLVGQLDAQCLQNGAVARFYQGLVAHMKGILPVAQQQYRSASAGFSRAADEWHRSEMTDSATKCRQAAEHVEEISQRTSRASEAGLSVPRGSRLVNEPLVPDMPEPAFSVPPPLPSGDLVFAAAILLCAFAFLTWMVYDLTERLETLVALPALGAMIITAVLVYRHYRGGGLWLHVQQDQVAVVEQGGRRFTLKPGAEWLEIPWLRSVRALVPRKILSHVASWQDAPLRGASGTEDARLDLKVRVHYQVRDPELATRAYESALHDADRSDIPAGEDELKPVWNSRIEAELLTLVRDETLGYTDPQAVADPRKIEPALRGHLTLKTRRWGIDIQSLRIARMEVG